MLNPPVLETAGAHPVRRTNAPDGDRRLKITDDVELLELWFTHCLQAGRLSQGDPLLRVPP
jgi:hypothetical protein